jgi:predicted ArsR family transcriptional regulator
VSNSRSFRRRLKITRPAQGHAEQSRRQPWNKGLALTTSPSLRTVRRWLEACVAEGLAERKTAEPDGKPGRPPVMYHVTEKGRAQPRPSPEVERMQWERLRRWENAKKRQRIQRNAQTQNALARKQATAARKMKAAADALDQAQAKLLTMELIAGGIKALAQAGAGTATLYPEEVDALVEAGCVIQRGDGMLSLAEDCLEAFDRIANDDRAGAAK